MWGGSAARTGADGDAGPGLVTLAHYEDDLNVPTSAEFLIPLEQLIHPKAEPAAAAPPAPTVPTGAEDAV
jgi:hypothetical protein